MKNKGTKFLNMLLAKRRNPCIIALYMLDYCKLMSNLESFYEIKKWHSLCTTYKQ